VSARRTQYAHAGNVATDAGQAATSGGLWSTVGQVAGYVWNLPNTVVGAAYGIIGIPTQGIGFENGQFQFKGNLLQRGVSWILTGGETGAITLGDAGVYPPGFGPERPMDIVSGQTLGLEESFHSIQGRILGPLYLPANILGGAAGIIGSGSWHGSGNFMERGPHRIPPTVF
jgi:hypothetical protein